MALQAWNPIDLVGKTGPSYWENPFIKGVAHVSPTKNDRETIWNFSGSENPWLNNDKPDPYEGLNWFQKANKMAKEGLLNAGVAESSYMNNPFIGGVAHVVPTENDREVIVDHAAGGVIRPTTKKDLQRRIYSEWPKNPGSMIDYTNPDTGETK